ncbi:tapasin-like isoform X2 [Parambassis ranga]|uniref:Tapasin-like isoform X2 n=1 Tax=Parambassis ranga TaxID=210632 RepID=A0A6P7JHM4_9TELE|nr:tapasin-like isoform X2 [Parambassis ranga]
MDLTWKMFIYSVLCAGVRCVQQISWLPCQFSDERVLVKQDGNTDIQHVHRDAALQFGLRRDPLVNPRVITFLITGSKLDLRRYMEGVEADQLECELRRYRPVQGPVVYNSWFSCTLKHRQGLFTVTSVLRQLTAQPHPGQQEHSSWPAIKDGEILTTSVSMVIKTQTPLVKAGLGSHQKLHCQFEVDHTDVGMRAAFTVEWHQQYEGKKTKLFSHNTITKKTEGAGVDLQALTGGDASYTVTTTKMSSEGTYVCSVSLTPLSASVDIQLHIEEPPRVSLNVGSTLSLQRGMEQKVVCEAVGYYPLDVDIYWSNHDQVESGQGGHIPPHTQLSIQYSNHKRLPDKTFSVSAYFYLQASPKDSGKEFTCNVSHQSLRMPITKSFTLVVEDPVNRMLYLTVVVPWVFLFLLLRRFHRGKGCRLWTKGMTGLLRKSNPCQFL